MKFLGGLTETKAARSNGDSIARATASSRSATFGGWGLGPVGNWDLDKAVEQAYERVVWVARACDVIATNQANLAIRLTRGYGQNRVAGEWVEDDRLWKVLNFKANSYETAWQFRYRLSVNLLLSRRGAFIEMRRGNDGRISELHLLPAGSTSPIPDPDLFVSGYSVQRKDGGLDFLERDQVIWVKVKPHPTDPYAQTTPLMAAGVAAETDWLAQMFNRNFLANDGRPGLLVSIQGHINPIDAEEIKRRLSGGPMRAGETSVIESEGIDIADMSASPRDIQWLDLMKWGKEEILMAFGVPESIMGNASGRTYDNADAERENFWLDTEQNHCDAIASAFDVLTDDIDDDVVVVYDYSNIDVLQRVKRLRLQAKREEVLSGLATIDEYLIESGREAWDVPLTRALITNMGIGIAKTPEDQEAIAKAVKIGEPAQIDPSETARAGAEQGSLAGVREFGNQVAARALAFAQGDNVVPIGQARGLTRRAQRPLTQNSQASFDGGFKTVDLGAIEAKVVGEKTHPYQALRDRNEGIIEGVLLGWDERQEKVISDRLTHSKFRKGTRHWEGAEGETKGLPKNQKCEFCSSLATKRVLHSEGMAYIPTCDAHLEKAKDAAARSVPGGEYDVSNINRVDDIKATKALDPNYAVEVDRWVAELKQTLLSQVQALLVREAKNAARDLKNTGILDRMQEDREDDNTAGDVLSRVFGTKEKAEAALNQVFNSIDALIEEAAKNQSARISNAIAELDGTGKSISEIQANVKRLTSLRSPWRKALSANIVTSTVEGARAAVYRQGGDYVMKVWNAEHDERTRPSHRGADGQERKVSRPFVVGKSLLMFPGDPTAPPSEVVNCRCWLDYVPSDDFYESGE